LGVVAVLVARLFMGPSLDALDEEKIVVFPLEELNLSDEQSGAGWDVALMVGSALEQTDPLKWIEARRLLPPGQRDSVHLLSADDARGIAIRLNARYYVQGVVRAGGPVESVSLVLHDVAGDSVYARRSADAPVGSVELFQLGLAAVRGILPVLIDPERTPDLSALEARDVGAMALWLQGEREYRNSHFGRALGFYERAVEADSALVLAAVKGAQAANWDYEYERGRDLIDIALVRGSLLPERHRDLARGIRFFTLGRSDSARTWLELAVQADTQWAEARMALGELAYHQLPQDVSLDSLYSASFEAARLSDPGFSPPLYHLTEIATRSGDVDAAGAYLETLRAFDPDPSILHELETALECVSRGADGMDWSAAARRDVFVTLVAARQLATGGAHQLDCAEGGFEELLRLTDSDIAGQELISPLSSIQASALLGLQGTLVSKGRVTEAASVLDSAFTGGRRQAITLIVMNTVAGSSMRTQAVVADSWAKERYGEEYEGMTNPESMWIMAAWNAFTGDLETATRLYDALSTYARSTGDPYDGALAQAVRGHLSLAQGDAGAAINQWTRLTTEADRQRLVWRPAASLPLERYLLARLLLESGRYEEAERVASAFDHPEPTIFVGFVAASLGLRYDAAQRLDASERAEGYRARLSALGRLDLAELP